LELDFLGAAVFLGAAAFLVGFFSFSDFAAIAIQD
jgi:hypothetical protein